MLLWVFAACDSADTLAHGHESMLARQALNAEGSRLGEQIASKHSGFNGIGDFSVGFHYQRMELS